MFSMSWSEKGELQGTIYLTKLITGGLGPYVDIFSQTWGVKAIYSFPDGQYVSAVRKEHLHPYFTDTSGRGFGFVSQRWEAYKIEVVDEDWDKVAQAHIDRKPVNLP